MRNLRPATTDQAANLLNALEAMRTARRLIGKADCPQSKKRLDAALKSAEGALRHMRRRLDVHAA